MLFGSGLSRLGFLDRLNKNQPWSCPLGIRRFFVSPEESGELCLIASIMGESGDIFFPKLDEEKDMIPFDQIAKDLLKELGLEPDICESEQEAREKAAKIASSPSRSLAQSPPRPLAPSQKWPIYFFGSNTSGEKSFEEFYTETETLDNDSFINLGVIKNSTRRNIDQIDAIFNQLHDLFENKEVTKAKIVDILKSYLPNFEHIETGKGLDSKM